MDWKSRDDVKSVSIETDFFVVQIPVSVKIDAFELVFKKNQFKTTKK